MMQATVPIGGSLQDAINAAKPGSTIMLPDGYVTVESVSIDKPLSILGSISGTKPVIGPVTANASGWDRIGNLTIANLDLLNGDLATNDAWETVTIQNVACRGGGFQFQHGGNDWPGTALVQCTNIASIDSPGMGIIVGRVRQLSVDGFYIDSPGRIDPTSSQYHAIYNNDNNQGRSRFRNGVIRNAPNLAFRTAGAWIEEVYITGCGNGISARRLDCLRRFCIAWGGTVGGSGNEGKAMELLGKVPCWIEDGLICHGSAAATANCHGITMGNGFPYLYARSILLHDWPHTPTGVALHITGRPDPSDNNYDAAWHLDGWNIQQPTHGTVFMDDVPTPPPATGAGVVNRTRMRFSEAAGWMSAGQTVAADAFRDPNRVPLTQARIDALRAGGITACPALTLINEQRAGYGLPALPPVSAMPPASASVPPTGVVAA